MRPGWKGRLLEWVCRHFGHRATFSKVSGVKWCARCGYALPRRATDDE